MMHSRGPVTGSFSGWCFLPTRLAACLNDRSLIPHPPPAAVNLFTSVTLYPHSPHLPPPLPGFMPKFTTPPVCSLWRFIEDIKDIIASAGSVCPSPLHPLHPSLLCFESRYMSLIVGSVVSSGPDGSENASGGVCEPVGTRPGEQEEAGVQVGHERAG